jgi:ribonuclease HI
MYFDGAPNLEGAREGVLFISPRGEQIKYVLQIHYKASNNGAEYEALIHMLRIAVSLASSDNRLTVIPRSSLIRSTRSETMSKTQWMLIALRSENSKSSMSHATTMLLKMSYPS